MIALDLATTGCCDFAIAIVFGVVMIAGDNRPTERIAVIDPLCAEGIFSQAQQPFYARCRPEDSYARAPLHVTRPQ